MKPISLIMPKNRANSESSGNIAKDFEDLIDASAISPQEPMDTSTESAAASESFLSFSNVLPSEHLERDSQKLELFRQRLKDT